MQPQLVKLTIPLRLNENGHKMAVIVMPKEREKPVRKVLVAMLYRLYNKERKVKTIS